MTTNPDTVLYSKPFQSTQFQNIFMLRNILILSFQNAYSQRSLPTGFPTCIYMYLSVLMHAIYFTHLISSDLKLKILVKEKKLGSYS